MTRTEFLQELKNALGAEVDAYTVQENLNYYDQYIMDEMNKGRTEGDILNELGDPWLIARTIIDAPGGNSRGNVYQQYEESADTQDSYGYESGSSHLHVYSTNTWWKKLLAVLVVVGVIFIVISIVTGIISLVAPIVVPILVIVLVVRLIGNTRR